MSETAKKAIEAGRAVLGIEFGSTRIKAVLVDETHAPIAMGTHDWENRLESNAGKAWRTGLLGYDAWLYAF